MFLRQVPCLFNCEFPSHRNIDGNDWKGLREERVSNERAGNGNCSKCGPQDALLVHPNSQNGALFYIYNRLETGEVQSCDGAARFFFKTGERFTGGFFDTDCNGWSPIGLVAALYTPLWDAVIRPPGISLVGIGNAPN